MNRRADAARSPVADDPGEPLRARLLAILAADAAGYSRLMSLDDRATVAALDSARAVFRAAIGTHGGRVVDMAGDSVLAAFDTALGAVQTALAVQRALREAQHEQPDERSLRFRIGVHLGDVIEKADGSVYGDGVNIAARLQALAEPGGVNVSQAVHGLVLNRVAAGFDDLGEQQVKNIAQPVRAYRVRAHGDAADEALRFGRFEIQPRERRLLVDGIAASLGARAFDLLLALARRPDQLVAKNQLMELVWPDVVVEENNLQQHMSALRRLLGPDAIATVPGRGYRFSARLDAAPEAPRGTPGPVLAAPPGTPGPVLTVLPAEPAPKLKTNLPATLTPLIGRADELASIGSLLDEHRLVTLVGAGGMGKTLLAQHLLAGRERRYAHGVCWVELAPLADASAIPGAIAAALGVRSGDADEPALAALGKALAPLELLLALDNAEHLLADIAAAADALHRAAPKLMLLVTSQAPLKLAAERVVRLGPLSVPAEPLPAADALGYGAVALFVERAQAADARFTLVDANTPAVIELCRALDGLALAIELAAARAPTLGVQRLAASMHERLRLLTSSRNRAAPQRQQTLRAALEWSHALLAEREQAVFRRLGVVAGSASLELVQRITACERWNEWDVLDALDTLVERSLVAVLGADDVAEPRYRLLDTPRAYAVERLAAAAEADTLRRRHAQALAARFYAAFDERYSGRIGVAAWERSLVPDLDNAREAFAWARDRGDAATALRIGPTLTLVLPDSLRREHIDLGAACEALISPDVPPALQLRAWLANMRVWGVAEDSRMLAAARQALALARTEAAQGEPFWLYLALGRLATSLAQRRDAAGAEAALAEMRTLEDRRWPPQRLISGREAAARAAMWLGGDAAASLQVAREQLSLHRAAGNEGFSSLVNLVDFELAAGEVDAARRSGAELLAQLQGTREELNLAYARLNVTAARLAGGDVAGARELIVAGWPQAVQFDMQHYWADYLALLAALDRRPRAAARLAGYSDAGYARREDSRQVNEAQAWRSACGLARAALGEAEFERLAAAAATLRDDEATALAFGSSDSA